VLHVNLAITGGGLYIPLSLKPTWCLKPRQNIKIPTQVILTLRRHCVLWLTCGCFLVWCVWCRWYGGNVACRQLLLCGFAFSLCSGQESSWMTQIHEINAASSRFSLSYIYFRCNIQNLVSWAVQYTCLHSDVDLVYFNKRIMKEANRIKSQRTGFIVVWIRRMLPTFRSNMLSPSSGWSTAVFYRGCICLNYTIL